MAGAPFWAGTVTSQTPKAFLAMELALASQLSAKSQQSASNVADEHTEITDQRCLDGVRRPFPVDNIAIWLRNEAERFIALRMSANDRNDANTRSRRKQ